MICCPLYCRFSTQDHYFVQVTLGHIYIYLVLFCSARNIYIRSDLVCAEHISVVFCSVISSYIHTGQHSAETSIVTTLKGVGCGAG